MTGQQLKNSILQLAIQGKLVPQDPNDEPTSELLKRIRKEKEQMVKEGKLKKKDLEVTPIAEDEKPFEIPKSWEWVRLKDIVSFVGGYAYKSSEFINTSPYQVLRLGNVKNDYLKLDTSSVFIPESLAVITEKYKCLENDILITMTGTRKKRDYFFTYRVRSTDSNLFLNQRVGALRPVYGITALFLTWALKSETVLQDVFQYETGTANQGNLGAENILKVHVPLPPLAEQKRIVAKIEELLPLVEEYGNAQEELNKLNATLPDKLRQSILQEAIMGKLVPQDPNDEPASKLLERIQEEKKRLVKEGKLKKKDLEVIPITDEEKPFDLPNGWEWVRLKDICTKIVDGDHNPPKGLNTQTQFIMISSQNINNNTIVCHDKVRYLNKETFEKENLRTRAENGDIFITSVGTLGRSCVYEGGLNVCFQRSVTIIKTLSFNYLLKFFFDSPYIQQYIVNNATGTAQKGFYINQMEDLVIPLPPINEQHRIVARLEELLPKLNELK